jgi:hypothetical protein
MKPVKILSAMLVGLWLSACTQAVSPDATKSKPVATESKKEETVENTSAGQTTSRETAGSEPQETREKRQTSRTAPPDATMPEKQETGENTSGGRTKSQNTANAKLEAARENLRISQATEERISSELEQLKKSGKASPEAIRDYEIYHERVQAMVAENRKIVEQMEAARARYSPAKTGSDKPPAGELEKMLDPNIPEEQTVDDIATLDRELNSSLAKFDDMLLQEMEAIHAKSAKKMQDLAEEAAEAAKRLREKGVEVNTSGSESSDETEESSTETDPNREAQKGEAGSETASGDNSRKSGGGPSRKDQRPIDYGDDDIVARQLREAAENETDPELKEKLWKEYEDYKKNTP